VTQIPLPVPRSVDTSGRLGVPPGEIRPEVQSPVYVELINKLAWAIGTTYGVPYSSMRTLTREIATDLAKLLINSQGYPMSGRY